jgi:hypothetical protein
MSDDVSDTYVCDVGFLNNIAYTSSGGNGFISMSRLISFFLLFGFNYHNKMLLERKQATNSVFRGMSFVSKRLWLRLRLG